MRKTGTYLSDTATVVLLLLLGGGYDRRRWLDVVIIGGQLTRDTYRYYDKLINVEIDRRRRRPRPSVDGGTDGGGFPHLRNMYAIRYDDISTYVLRARFSSATQRSQQDIRVHDTQPGCRPARYRSRNNRQYPKGFSTDVKAATSDDTGDKATGVDTLARQHNMQNSQSDDTSGRKGNTQAWSAVNR